MASARLRVLLPLAVLALLGAGVAAFAVGGSPSGDPGRVPPPSGTESTEGRTADAETAATSPASRNAWRKQANAICDRLSYHFADLEPSPALDPGRTAAASRRASSGIAQLRALPAPPGDAPKVERMLDLLESALEHEEKAIAAVRGGDPVAALQLDADAFALTEKASEIARELGAVGCAEGASGKTLLARQLAEHDVVVVVLYAPRSAVDALAVAEARAGAAAVGAGFLVADVSKTGQLSGLAVEQNIRAAPSVLVFDAERIATRFTGFVDRETVAQAAENARA